MPGLARCAGHFQHERNPISDIRIEAERAAQIAAPQH
jgi:hypothetical protein